MSIYPLMAIAHACDDIRDSLDEIIKLTDPDQYGESLTSGERSDLISFMGKIANLLETEDRR